MKDLPISKEEAAGVRLQSNVKADLQVEQILKDSP